MPYEWLPPSPDGPRAELHLWPYRSLPKRGFVWFVGGTAALISMPLWPLLGTWLLWGLLPFLMIAVGGLWWGLSRSYRDGDLIERLVLEEDRITLTRHNPRGPEQRWEANPYWVQVTLHPSGGPVEDYLTLKGDGREVELGAFLSPEERRRLRGEVLEALAQHR